MCITFVRETAQNDISKYTSWGCASTSTLFPVLAEVTKGGSSSASGMRSAMSNLRSIQSSKSEANVSGDRQYLLWQSD